MACLAALVAFGAVLFLAAFCGFYNRGTITGDMALSTAFVARLWLRFFGAITRKMTFKATIVAMEG